jgi:hypothetical protein
MQRLPQAPGPLQGVDLLPTLPTYSHLYRLLDDITLRHAKLIAEHCGGDPARILEVGYGLVSPAFLKRFDAAEFVKRGSIVLACRNATGEVMALHDHYLQWLTAAAVHVANPVRAPWAEIQICETTSLADSLALSENICAIGRNGCDKKTLAAAVLSARRSEGTLDGRRLAA